MLNIWYSLGLMSVFLVLATLACGASLGIRSENLSWGEQFSSTTFNIVMSCVVFVMALSFLGIWEIPIPGFVGSGKTAEVATHEGAAGAVCQRGAVDRACHAVQWAAVGFGVRLHVATIAGCDLRHLRLYWFRDGFAVFADRRISAVDSLFAQAWGLDGHVQAHHGVCATGHRGISIFVFGTGLCGTDFRATRRAVGGLLVDWPRSADG